MWFMVNELYQQRELVIDPSVENGCRWQDIGPLYNEVTEQETFGNPDAHKGYKDQFDTCVPCWKIPVSS